MSDSEDNLPTRVVFATLRPAVKLAMSAGVSLKDAKRFIELAYYKEARSQGLKMREMADLLSVSMSKVGLLSKQLKEHFLEPELEHGVARQILSLLWASPLTEARIAQALDEFDDDDVARAIDQLVEEGRIRRIEGRTDQFELTSEAHRLSTDAWMAKVDGLNTLMDSVSSAISARFDRGDDRALVRNIAFRVRAEDVDELKKLYQEVIFKKIVELDAAVEGDETSVPIRMSVLWSPDEEEE